MKAIMVKDYLVRFLDCDFECIDADFGINKDVDIVLRPEDIELLKPTEGKPTGEVVSSIFKGVHYEMRVICGDELILSHSTKYYEPGTIVSIDVRPENIQVMHVSEWSDTIIGAKRAQLRSWEDAR